MQLSRGDLGQRAYPVHALVLSELDGDWPIGELETGENPCRVLRGVQRGTRCPSRGVTLEQWAAEEGYDPTRRTYRVPVKMTRRATDADNRTAVCPGARIQRRSPRMDMAPFYRVT